MLLVLRLSPNGQALHAIMKYDHEEVLTYATDVAGGRSRAKVSRVLNTFVEKADSIQKSCLIRLAGAGGEVCVRDRSRRGDISEYFRSFLAVRRRHTPADLTQRLVAATRSALGKVADELPSVVRGNANQRIYEAIQRTDGFDPDDARPTWRRSPAPFPAIRSCRKPSRRRSRGSGSTKMLAAHAGVAPDDAEQAEPKAVFDQFSLINAAQSLIIHHNLEIRGANDLLVSNRTWTLTEDHSKEMGVSADLLDAMTADLRAIGLRLLAAQTRKHHLPEHAGLAVSDAARMPWRYEPPQQAAKADKKRLSPQAQPPRPPPSLG